MDGYHQTSYDISHSEPPYRNRSYSTARDPTAGLQGIALCTARVSVHPCLEVLSKPTRQLLELLRCVVAAEAGTPLSYIFRQLIWQIRNRQGVSSEVEKPPRNEGVLVAAAKIVAIRTALKSSVREVLTEWKFLSDSHEIDDPAMSGTVLAFSACANHPIIHISQFDHVAATSLTAEFAMYECAVIPERVGRKP